MFNTILKYNHRLTVHSRTTDLIPSALQIVIANIFSNKCLTLLLFIFLYKDKNTVLEHGISSGLGPSTKKLTVFYSRTKVCLQKHVHFTVRNKVKILVCHVFITVDDAQARNKTA